MASNTLRSVRSAFGAVLCMALVLSIKVEESRSSIESMGRGLPQPANRPLFDRSSAAEKKDECNCVCGVSRNNRIVGGTRAGKTEFPWLVAIFKFGEYNCGGSLITEKHVLTAAHCFNNVNIKDVKIVLGAYDINSKTEKFLRRSVKSVTKHPDFDIDINYDSDIAVVELDQPVTLGASNIGTACLPSETYREYDHQYATVVGRGRTSEGGPPSPIPLKVEVPLMTIKDCTHTLHERSQITDNMLCAGYPEGESDSCKGDSGGPLNFRITNTNMSTMEVIGVVSWGEGCARPNLPGIYTRVQKFVSWIRKQIAGACECTRA